MPGAILGGMNAESSVSPSAGNTSLDGEESEPMSYLFKIRYAGRLDGVVGGKCFQAVQLTDSNTQTF